MTTIYTVITDEPLDAWCVPKYEGQVIETSEKSRAAPIKAFSPEQYTTPTRRRWVATMMGYDDESRLTWVEVPPTRL